MLEHASRRVQAADVRLLDAADTAGLTDLSRLVDDEHAAVVRAGHPAATPALLRAPPDLTAPT